MSRNLAEGNGFVYNVGERVCASTCPLHTLIVAGVYRLLGNMYWSALFCNLVESALAVFLLLRFYKKDDHAVIFITLAIICNKAFMMYTTSGLENSLLFLLFALMLQRFWKYETFRDRHLFELSFLVGLIATTRMDTTLMAFPILFFAWLRRDRKSGGGGYFSFVPIIAGMVPFVAWILFSTVYYGFPFPNTAYAKLGAGFPLSDYLIRGVSYYTESFPYSPLILAIPLYYIIISGVKKSAKDAAVSVGIILYFAYIVSIGGDFMPGRHFTVPFFVSLWRVFALTRVDMSIAKTKFRFLGTLSPILACVVLFCIVYQSMPVISFLQRTWRVSAQHGEMYWATDRKPNNISWKNYTSIIRVLAALSDGAKDERESLRLTGPEDPLFGKTIDTVLALRDSGVKGDIDDVGAGLMVYYWGKGLYLNDAIALADPLLARMPGVYDKSWVVGHIRHLVPPGYRESVQTGENRIENASLALYYDKIRLITRSENLFAPERLKAIGDINLGKYDYLLAAER